MARITGVSSAQAGPRLPAGGITSTHPTTAPAGLGTGCPAALSWRLDGNPVTGGDGLA
jgi:hypothetical protein